MKLTFLSLKNSFCLLKKWRIKIIKHGHYAAQTCFHPTKRQATIYCCKGKTPVDFWFHELLHVNFRELIFFHKTGSIAQMRAAEILIRDICQFIREEK